MKKYLTILAAMLFCASMQAQTVKVHLVNGNVVSYPANEVEFVDFGNNTSDVTKTAVDLGIKKKWCNINVGATKEWESGKYFAYGMAFKDGKTVDDNDKFEFKKDNYTNANKDAASEWDSSYRMPTRDEILDLMNNTDNFWGIYCGVTGRMFINKNDSTKRIFIPAVGCFTSEITENGRFGSYWSSTAAEGSGYHCGLFFGSEEENPWNFFQAEENWVGLPIRAVLIKQ